MHRILKCAIDTFPELEFNDPEHRIVFIKSLLMLCGAIKILSRFSEKAIRSTLRPILESFLGKIGEALEHYSDDKEVYLTICNFYCRSIKALGPDFDQFFSRIATDCFNAFSKNIEYTKCLDVCSLSLTLMSAENPEAQKFIDENFTILAGLILDVVDIKNNYDITKSFAELCSRIARKCKPDCITKSIHIKKIIILFTEFLMETIENDANSEIVFFLNDLICHKDIEVRESMVDYIEYIGSAFIVAIPNMRSIVSQTFAKCLTKMCLEYPQIIPQCIDTAFQNPKFNEVQNLKAPLTNCLIGFKENSRQFKMTILDFQSVMRGTGSPDLFIGREIQLNKAEICID